MLMQTLQKNITDTTLAVDSRQAQRVRLYRIQDFLFERISQFFALLVLVILASILVSLTLRAIPILKHVGIGFF